MSVHPPKLAKKILEKLQYDDVWKTTVGDFDEYFHYLAEKEGAIKAKQWYWRQIFRYAPSKITHKFYWSVAMFLNYIKISFRNLKKHKGYSFINIFGLAAGLICFVLIGLFVQYELSYDSFHENSDRTYRIIAQQPDNEYMGSDMFALTPTAMAATMKSDFPEVEAATYFGNTRTLLSIEDQTFREPGVIADGDFFQIFSYQWYEGNPESALNDPNSIILTNSLANKLFGRDKALGKSIDQTYGTWKTVTKTVTGVISDPPENSHFTFQYVVNDQTTPYYQYNLDEWSNTNYYTFITLQEGVSKEVFSEKLPGFAKNYIGSSDYYKNLPEKLPIHSLQPLEDIHLHSKSLNFNPASSGDINTVYMFSAIAIIILLIACVNYMNLSTARSLNRSKEIGVRKVVGAIRANLVVQFLSEAVVISLVSLGLSVLFIALVLPIFSDLIDRELTSQIFLQWDFWALTLAAGFGVGIISGSYPAFFTSNQKPSLIFKSHVRGGQKTSLLRNALVIGQFTVTIILLIGSIVVFQQLNFLRNADTGLNRDQVVAVSTNDEGLWDRFETFKSELVKNPSIQMVSSSQFEPTYMSSRTVVKEWSGRQEGEELSAYISPVGFDFIEMFDIEIIQGRSFSEDQFTETQADYIINEAAIRELGWTKEEAIGKSFTAWGNSGTIVGVARNFNFLSLHQKIEPLAIMLAPAYNHRYILVKINGGQTQQTLSDIQEVVASFSPEYPFSYTFLDDSYNNLYNREIQLSTIFNYFTFLALIIASLGLFGLATFVTEQRTKEIGIRKVLGANVFQILTLLNKDFLKLVAFSFIIAAPAGWFLSNNWLQDFAYRIEVGPAIILLSALLAFGIALITISFKSIKTAIANPINSLKSE
jgi:putative ABC transport system permease protein